MAVHAYKLDAPAKDRAILRWRVQLVLRKDPFGVGRGGFTLLEMLLATFVSVLLMGALYVAMDTQIRYAAAGRDRIEESTLAHSLLARMSNDIKKCVIQVSPTPLPPLSASSNSSNNSANATSPTPSNSGGSPSTGTPPTGSTDASASAGTSSSSAASDTIQFRLGVQGTPTTLSLYLSRLPTELYKSRAEALSDLRLVSYWLAGDASSPVGLARREFLRVTSDEANSQPATANNGTDGAWLAPEVKSLQFRYFDGTNWYDTWDGTETGWDYVTPIGPPALIEITLGMVVPTTDNRFGELPTLKSYRHVVAIPMADGVAH